MDAFIVQAVLYCDAFIFFKQEFNKAQNIIINIIRV